MNLMKRLFALVMVLCVMLSLCACGGSGSNDATDESSEPTVTEGSNGSEENTDNAENADDGLVDYTVTVTDENGSPIVGALVQLCMDTCYPSATGEDGVANFHVEEADYKVSFLTLPEGYTYSGDEDTFYFEDGSTDMVIVLKAAE